MRKQSEGLTKEYDRLLEEHRKIQVSMPCPALGREAPLHGGGRCSPAAGPSRARGSRGCSLSLAPPFSVAAESGPSSQNPLLGRRSVV